MQRNKQKYCQNCIFPYGLGAINLATGKPMLFHKIKGVLLCESCEDILSSGNFPSGNYFEKEFEKYINNHNRLLYAYSGGLDSTVVLAILAKKCQQRGINLDIFTINTGVKGKITNLNIKAIIKHLGLERQHFFVDITNEIQNNPQIVSIAGKIISTLEFYNLCFQRNILPCGRLCNSIIDGVYKRIMKEKRFTELVTGGDTPKKTNDGVYSIFWKKPSGIRIIRGGYAFNLSKKKNTQYLKENKIPWVNCKCGGYDTDCLNSRSFFARGFGGQSNVTLEKVVDKYPIIINYLTERVRFGIIEQEEALKMFTNIDIASLNTYIELESIFSEAEEKN